MRLLLAMMEEVPDSLVRELLTEINEYDLCITKFCGWWIVYCKLKPFIGFAQNYIKQVKQHQEH
ncbi:MAG: hypothetical protein ACL7BU_13215 [Candidatus Phlomobacter fragariae]